jgi:zinc transport system permease protein
MFDWLQLDFMQRALVAGLTVAAICPMIGLFLVLRRLSLIGDGLGHIAFAGVAAGWLMGAYPPISALAFTTVGAVGIEWLRSRQRAYADLALALFFYSGISTGVVLAARQGAFNASLLGYLFGSITTISTEDLWFVFGLGLAVVVLVTVFYKELFALSYDEATAQVSGVPVRRLNLLVALLTAVTVTVGMRIVGLLMVAALMIVPVASALQLARGFLATLLWSVAYSVASLAVGLAFSYYLDLPPGGTIVLTAVGLFLLTLVSAAVVRGLRRAARKA